jgi:butyryl-CoA dehydrogenase
MDLLGRKVTMAKGKAVKLLLQEIQNTMEEAAKQAELKPLAAQLGQVTKQLHKVTLSLLELASKDKPEVFLADATLYLEYFGTVIIAWQWLRQATVASIALQNELPAEEYDFYQGKVYTCRYFFEYELPKTSGLAYRLTSEDRLTLEIEESFIN